MSQYYEVIAVSSDGDCFDEMIKSQGVNGYKINMTRKITPISDLKSLIQLIRLFINEKPDIVHTHTPKAGTLGMIAAWITKVPIRIHTVAGLPLLVATGNKRKLLNFVEKITYACATKIYPNSYNLLKIIENLKLAKSEKLKVIAQGSSNGIDLSYFSRKNFPEITHNQDYFTFCFVGRIVRDKGIDELVSAFKRLYESNNNIRLIIVGNFEKKLDPISPNSEKLILHHPGIKFVGYQTDVRPFLIQSHALVFPSYREGFPNVVMQAGALDLPCIVTDINGCNEIIIPNKNGIIIPPRDENALFNAMKNFITNKEMVKSMSQNAREMISSRYDQKFVWNELLNEYNNLLNKSYV